MGRHHLGKTHLIALPSKVQWGGQISVEYGPLLDVGVAVVKDLGEESIRPLGGTHVTLEQDQLLLLVAYRPNLLSAAHGSTHK